MQRRRTLHGFTLIELLVVISIIALLISLLLPALKQARWQANVAKCLAQQRQIAVASMAYSSDEKGYFLPAGVESVFATLDRIKDPDGDSRDLLYKYTNSKEVFYCPDSFVTRSESLISNFGGWDSGEPNVVISYAIVGGAPGPPLSSGYLSFLQLGSTGQNLGDAVPWFERGVSRIQHESHVTQSSKAPFSADSSRAYRPFFISDPGVFEHNHTGYLSPTLDQVGTPAEGFYGGNTIYFDGHGTWNEMAAMGDSNGPSYDLNIIYITNQGDYYGF